MDKTKSSKPVGKLVKLSPSEIRALQKAHRGFEAFAKELLDLYEANPGTLRIEGMNLPMLRSAMALYEGLEGPETTTRKQLQKIHDTRLLQSSIVWVAMLEIYARAQAVARTDVDMKRAIADFEQFMKIGPRKRTPTGKAPTTAG